MNPKGTTIAKAYPKPFNDLEYLLKPNGLKEELRATSAMIIIEMIGI
jgi:hypothetical protein